ncbi:dynamin family protein [Dethiosulfovibrio salsuginis]|uniref:Dynamin family protein n=1 Tax=Dethiosulfovibrio salsuginis TaxID=561720 RepID=A0A1X7L9T2_9BACT|nr:dynamin family protein [Dethiosulfovibrio salsuginis]SMG50307.1 Dynamin family protein [Dethiosulfovibrio salsuginis]
MDRIELSKNVSGLISELSPYRSFVEQELTKIESLTEDLHSDIEQAAKEGRKLRIGVVGQVKSGKSSFLNALIFGGTGILPKAATPMTAALTVIEHAPNIKATIEFYTKEDWDTIEKAARDWDIQAKDIEKRMLEAPSSPFGSKDAPVTKEQIKAAIDREIPDDIKASKELVDMAQRSNIDLKAHLGQKEELIGLSSLEDLMGKLQEYVGSNGRFTPIVRNTTISSNVPEMEGIEIVDTPGINDPVISRGRLTKKRIGECDVVFVLSQCSQFIDSVDLELLVQNLPAKGISKIILIGSQVDATLIGEKQKHSSLPKLMKGVVSGLEKRVEDLLENLIKKSRNEEEREILMNIKANPPVFVSSMAYAMSVHFDYMDEEEAHFLQLYNNLYPDKYSFDRTLLEDFSNISRTRAILEEVKSEKDEILANRLMDIEKGASVAFTSNLNNLIEKTEIMYKKIKTNDIATLEKQSMEITNRLKRGRNHIENAFDDAITGLNKKMEILKTEIKEISLEYKKIETKENTRTEEYKVNALKWWNPFSWWNSSKTEQREIVSRYANIHDAVEQVECFAITTEKRIKEEMANIIDLPKMQNSINNGVIKLFDMSDTSFDPDDILFPLKKTINSISIPSIDFGDNDYGGKISSQFSGDKVEDSNIDSLIKAQKNAIAEVLGDMSSAVESKAEEISSTLKKHRDSFLENILANIEKDLEETRRALQEKNKTLEAIENISNIVRTYI